MNRIVMLDTETTGLNKKGQRREHRIVEIACLEMIGDQLTGRQLHYYLNPERPIDPGAAAVHGITDNSVKDCQKFADIADELKEFIKDSRLIIHNAEYDIGMIEDELKIMGADWRIEDICKITCTLWAAWRADGVEYVKGYKLDQLMEKYEIKIDRPNHGALLDCQILAQVYFAMLKEGIIK